MRQLTGITLVRDGKSIIPAHDRGLEHGPTAFEDVPERLDPRRVFGMATYDAGTGFAVQKGLAETYYSSSANGVNLLTRLNAASRFWMGGPYAP